MSFQILLKIFFTGLGLSADSFSVALTDGLVYEDINKRKSFFIAFIFGFMQALMPLIGYWLVEIVEVLAGEYAGEQAKDITSKIIVWLAFALLIFIGLKMLIESIKEMKKPQEEKKMRLFSIKEVILYGFATSIDALATGVALHTGISTNTTIWIHASIIFVLCFALSLVGLFLGKQITKLLRGKTEISGIIGGCILVGLAIWVVIGNYV